VQLQADFRSALFNVALLTANDLLQPLQAVPYLKQLLQVGYLRRPSHPTDNIRAMVIVWRVRGEII